MDLCTFVCSGNLTHDPEFKFVGETAICNFSVANSRRRKVNGEWTDYTSYFDCTAFGGMAEFLNKHGVKGTRVGIEGVAEQDRWEDNAGQKRSKVQFIANRVCIYDRWKGDVEGSTNGEYAEAATPQELVGAGTGDNPF